MKNNKKRALVSLFLLIFFFFSGYKVGYKLYDNYISKQIYNKAKEEQEQNREKYLNKHNCDWITIPETNIDYPVVYGKGNDYYLTHDINDKFSQHGSIFYDEIEVPHEGNNTTIYGHSMNDGSMFNNLHIFRKDIVAFKNSRVYIYTKEGECKTYRPLGIYITNDDFFFYDLDYMTTKDAVTLIQEKSIYDIDVDYSENSEILTLVTCEYTEENNRLIIFYILEE